MHYRWCKLAVCEWDVLADFICQQASCESR
jgi:hypothetical protein